jgi:hypothetical protein
MPDITLTANETSAALSVTPLKVMSIETDKPVLVTSELGAELVNIKDTRAAVLIIPPSDEIRIKAFSGGAAVTYTIEE